jgi:hypothetical protein
MNVPVSDIREMIGPRTLAGYTTAVSLHAHTDYSKENMGDVAPYFERIPIVGFLARRELDAYGQRNQEALDFSKVWWHPPVDAPTVLEAERRQISERLGLGALVSITDHDTIDANLALRASNADESIPVSFEWTVPFESGFFHLGVHNLPPARATDVFDQLSRHSQAPQPGRLADLLACLDNEPDTLVVFNHPLWDLAGVGAAIHLSLVRRFMRDCGDFIHALELNGYRTSHENEGVHRLQGEYGLPLVSGGDRHGRDANALLNLTTATSFGEFVREIREQRQSTVLVMPEYRRSLVARKLATARDAMRHYPDYEGRRHWVDRIWSVQTGQPLPLADDWPDGGPLWVRLAIRTFLLSTTDICQPLMRALVRCMGASRSHDAGPADHLCQPSNPVQEASNEFV